MSDRRALKKWEIKYGPDAVYDAFNLGQDAARYPRSLPVRLRTNPYPPGKRHDNWERGFEVSAWQLKYDR